MEHPEWLRNETVFVRAEWDGRDAEVEGLTERVIAQLTDLSMITGSGDEWVLAKGTGSVPGQGVHS